MTMNRVSIFFLLLIASAMGPTHADPISFDGCRADNARFHRDSAGLSFLLARGADLPDLVQPIMGTTLMTILALNALNSTKPDKTTKSFGKVLKDFAVEKIGIPLYITYDRIKHEGLSKRDCALAGLGVFAVYAAKKVSDHYHLGASLKACDMAKTKAVFEEDALWLWNHKGRIMLGMGALAASAYFIKAALNLPIMERFKRSLTPNQKHLISTDHTLRDLMENAHENPQALLEHDHFTAHLHDHQKKLLDMAIENYKSEADPMSLFDDFVMDE